MKRYLAFISYRHREPDQLVSTALLKGLETYHLPKNSGLPAKRRVFRDADELPTGTDLGANIESALDESEWLIALCSEKYLASQWCLLEIERFVRMGRKERILPVLLSGTPETAVPEDIRDLPLAADLRGEDLSFDRKKLPKAVPALLARMAAREETGAAGASEKGASAAGPAAVGASAAGDAEAHVLQPEDFAAAERHFRWKAVSAAAACVLAGILGFAAYALHTADLIAEGNKRIAEATELTEKARAAAEERRKSAARKNAQYAAEQSLAEYRAGNEKEALALALSVLPKDAGSRETVFSEDPGSGETVFSKDAGSGEDISPEALGALRVAMSSPRLSYRKKSSAETEFSITKYTYIDPRTLLLEGEEYSETGTFLLYGTGETLTVDSVERSRAFSEGYSRAFVLRSSTKSPERMDRIFCGAEKQARILYPDGTGADLTLSGDPFFADEVVFEPWEERYLAWLEEPGEGQEGHMALFFRDRAEAVAEIPVEGAPLHAEFFETQRTCPEILVLDREGIVRIFNGENGSVGRELPGRWTSACFLDQKYRVIASDADGSGWSLLDTSTGEILMKVETPSPVRGLSYGGGRSEVLACCEDGVRVYSLKTGNLIWSLVPEEAPRFALWAGYTPGTGKLALVDGNAIVLLYDRRAEIWTLETEADDESAESIPLYREGMFNRSEWVFFSRDGRKVFVQMMNGTLECFHARDGSFLWSRENSWNVTGAHISGTCSADGKAIWMHGDGKTERIDAETGRSLYSIKDSGGRVPEECPEQDLGVLPAVGWDSMKGIELSTGKLLWEAEAEKAVSYSEDGGTLVYSEDGRSLFYIILGDSTENYGKELYYAVMDPRTGKVLKEKVLLRVPVLEPTSLNDKFRLSVRHGERIAVLSVYPGKAPAGLPVYLIDLEKGEITAEVKTPGPNTQVIFPAAGGIALRWMEQSDEVTNLLDYVNAYEDSYVFCCSLQMDGTMGEVIPVNSEEGRRLTARESQLIRFGGDEAVLNTVQYDRSSRFQSNQPNRIRRLSDNALLLDVGDSIIAAPPAGGNICIYMENITTAVTPVLLRDIDPGNLIRKAAERLEELQ